MTVRFGTARNRLLLDKKKTRTEYQVPSWVGTVVCLVLIAAAAFIAYSNSFGGTFVLDDELSISGNRLLKAIDSGHGLAAFVFADTRPTVNATIALNYCLGGLDVWGFHLLNVSVHALAGMTLFGLTRWTLRTRRLKRTFGRAAPPLALAVALVWAMHPIQTASVTYIIQRAEAMMGLFYLLVLYCLVRGHFDRHWRWAWYAGAIVACLLGAGAKQVIATVPLVAILYDRVFLARTWGFLWRRRKWLYLGLTGGWVVIIVLLQLHAVGDSAGFGVKAIAWWQYGLSQFGVIVKYLALTFWPADLCLDFAWPTARTAMAIVPQALAVLALLGASFWALWRRPAAGLVGLAFFLILAPTSSIMPIQDLLFPHRMYLPLACVVAAVVPGGWTLVRKANAGLSKTLAPAFWVLLGVVLLAEGYFTFDHNCVYRSSSEVWQDVVDKRPDNDRAWYNLGNCLRESGRNAEAVAAYKTGLTRYTDCPSVHPGKHEIENNLGQSLANLGRTVDALTHYREAVRLDPKYAPARSNLGKTLCDMGPEYWPEAETELQRCVTDSPKAVEGWYNFGVLRHKQGRKDEARTMYVKAVSLQPDLAVAHNNLGALLSEEGKDVEAIEEFRLAIRYQPRNEGAQYNLGFLLAKGGQFKEALGPLREAVKLRPVYPQAHHDLAMVEANLKDFASAMRHFETAFEQFAAAGDAPRAMESAQRALQAANLGHDPVAIERITQRAWTLESKGK